MEHEQRSREAVRGPVTNGPHGQMRMCACESVCAWVERGKYSSRGVRDRAGKGSFPGRIQSSGCPQGPHGREQSEVISRVGEQCRGERTGHMFRG